MGGSRSLAGLLADGFFAFALPFYLEATSISATGMIGVASPYPVSQCKQTAFCRLRRKIDGREFRLVLQCSILGNRR
jgi:hypothetical protein